MCFLLLSFLSILSLFPILPFPISSLLSSISYSRKKWREQRCSCMMLVRVQVYLLPTWCSCFHIRTQRQKEKVCVCVWWRKWSSSQSFSISNLALESQAFVPWKAHLVIWVNLFPSTGHSPSSDFLLMVSTDGCSLPHMAAHPSLSYLGAYICWDVPSPCPLWLPCLGEHIYKSSHFLHKF